MKKTYEKPGLLVENFALSQSIAAGCGVGANHTTLGKPTYINPELNCGWDSGAWTTWLESSTICDDKADVNDKINAGCYNNPAGEFQLFAS